MKTRQVYDAHDIGLPTVRGIYWCLCKSLKDEIILVEGEFNGADFFFFQNKYPLLKVIYWFTEK